MGLQCHIVIGIGYFECFEPVHNAYIAVTVKGHGKISDVVSVMSRIEKE